MALTYATQTHLPAVLLLEDTIIGVPVLSFVKP